MPAGTGTIGATVKAIETGICGALASAGRSEAALHRLARSDAQIDMCLCVRLCATRWALRVISGALDTSGVCHIM